MNKWIAMCLLVLVAACSVSHRVSNGDSEGPIPETFFSDIRNNKTDKQWILSNLGTPDYTQPGPEGKEIFTWALYREELKHGDILFFFRLNAAERETEFFHVFFRQDVVKKHWRDSYARVQEEAYFVEPTPRPIATYKEGALAPVMKRPQPKKRQDSVIQASPEPVPTPEPEKAPGAAPDYSPDGSEFRL